MTSQGHPHARFRRALERRSVANAWATAAEIGRLSLADSLGLCLLVLEREPRRYGRLALRWHARCCDELRLSLDAALVVLSLLACLEGATPLPAARALREFLAGEGASAAVDEVRRWEAFAASKD